MSYVPLRWFKSRFNREQITTLGSKSTLMVGLCLLYSPQGRYKPSFPIRKVRFRSKFRFSFFLTISVFFFFFVLFLSLFVFSYLSLRWTTKCDFRWDCNTNALGQCSHWNGFSVACICEWFFTCSIMGKFMMGDYQTVFWSWGRDNLFRSFWLCRSMVIICVDRKIHLMVFQIFCSCNFFILRFVWLAVIYFVVSWVKNSQMATKSLSCLE